MSRPEHRCRSLVTGATGFLGIQVVAQLRRSPDHEVWTTSRHPAASMDPYWCRADLTDERAIAAVVERARPDTVYHLAGRARVRRQLESKECYAIHACGTRNLMQALAAQREPARVLVVSSSAVYGVRAAPGEPFDEHAPPAPDNLYGESKREEEQIACSLASRKLSVCIVRPFNLIGRGQPLGLFARDLLAELRRRRDEGPWWEGTPERFAAVRDFIDVEDVAGGLRHLASLPELPAVVNLCSGVGTHLARVLEELCCLEGLPFTPGVISKRITSWQVGANSRLDCWRPAKALQDSLRDLWMSVP